MELEHESHFYVDKTVCQTHFNGRLMFLWCNRVKEDEALKRERERIVVEAEKSRR